MVIREREFGIIAARKLRPIAAGKFMGITSSPWEKMMAKKELRKRRLPF